MPGMTFNGLTRVHIQRVPAINIGDKKVSRTHTEIAVNRYILIANFRMR